MSVRLGKVLILLSVFIAASTVLAAPAQVLMIRHAEKPSTGEDLSPAGYARAQALVNYFETTPAVLTYGTPVAIYAMGYDQDKTASHRAIETVAPLAQSLGLTLHTAYTRPEIAPLVKEILSTPAYDGRMVLICWEHNVIPEIAKQFGEKNAPDSWADADFYSVWQLDFTGDVVSSIATFSEHLMPGDP